MLGLLLEPAQVKYAQKPVISYGMSGRLFYSATGFLLLSVPNALVRGIFDTLDEPGLELPMVGKTLNAHITVMRPEEIDQIGGPDVVSERGHAFHYNLGRLRTFTPDHLPDVSRVWILEVKSPELAALRRSYGLSKYPRDGESPFHITIALRKTNVLRENEINKFDPTDSSSLLLERSGV